MTISLKITCNTDQKEAKRIKLEEKNDTDPNPGEIETISNPEKMVVNPNPGEKIINPLREIRRNPNPGEKITSANPVEIKTNSNPGENGTNFCKFCEKSFTNKPDLNTHIALDHEKYNNGQDQFCEFCGKVFLLKHSLKSHLQTAHEHQQPSKCDPGDNGPDSNPGEKGIIDNLITITGKIVANPSTGEDMYINSRTGEIIANPNPGEKFMDSITGEITTIPNPGENGTNPDPGDNGTNPNAREKGTNPNAFSNLKISGVFSDASTTKSPALELVYQKVHEVKKHCQVMKEKVKTTNIEKDQWIRYFELVIKNVEKPDLTGFATKHKGWTALHEAACCGYDKILEQLMDETEDKNPQDEKGRTPLHEAAFLGMLSIYYIFYEISLTKSKHFWLSAICPQF